MAHVRFWQKRGCKTNARQREWLAGQGHSIEPLDLLTTPWTAATLSGFFGELSPAQWFNRASPRVKSGEVEPDTLDADAAMALLLADTLLIRRPLMEIGDWRCTGFDSEELERRFGAVSRAIDGSLEGCSHGHTGVTCETRD